MKRILVGLISILLLGSCGDSSADDRRIGGTGAKREGSWSQLAASPLSARYASQAVTMGDRLYIIGGIAAEPCPPNADCSEPPDPFFADGAAYDPQTQTWESIADAPVPIGHGSSVVVDGTLYLLVNGYGSSHPSVRPAFLSYDPEQDSWEEHESPPQQRERILAAAGSQVVAFQQSQENGIKGDLIYDAEADAWSRLAPDPLRPAYDRWMVGTDHGLVLIAISLGPREPDEPNLYAGAVLRGDRWESFGSSDIFGYNPEWSWTAGKVLNASTERADGGEIDNWGRTYNAGGTLDPGSGEWGLLPDAPQDRGGFEGITAAGERYSVAYSGWVYDAQEQRWFHVTRPAGAPDDDMATAWVGDGLYVWGGVDWQGSEGMLLDEGWVWHPED